MSNFRVPLLAATQLVIKCQIPGSQVITTFGVLPQNTVKGSWEEKKGQNSTSTPYLSRALGERVSKTLFPQVGDLQVLHAAGIFSSKMCRI